MKIITIKNFEGVTKVMYFSSNSMAWLQLVSVPNEC